jgi:hypothetical protein
VSCSYVSLGWAVGVVDGGPARVSGTIGIDLQTRVDVVDLAVAGLAEGLGLARRDVEPFQNRIEDPPSGSKARADLVSLAARHLLRLFLIRPRSLAA